MDGEGGTSRIWHSDILAGKVIQFTAGQEQREVKYGQSSRGMTHPGC
jgi:hypothetical protein